MISNPRDLTVQLLGELLFVERRLADSVIGDVADAVRDEELKQLLHAHREETRQHVERAETAFRRLEIAATSNLSRSFESAVAEHDAVAPSIVDQRLADLFHAHAALQVEHRELAAYRVLLPLLPSNAAELLRPTYAEEGEAAKRLVQIVDRLADEG